MKTKQAIQRVETVRKDCSSTIQLFDAFTNSGHCLFHKISCFGIFFPTKNTENHLINTLTRPNVSNDSVIIDPANWSHVQVGLVTHFYLKSSLGVKFHFKKFQ